MALKISFRKQGTEIKTAIDKRLAALQSRLDKRNESLDSLIQDEKRLRSYLIRSSQFNRSHGGYGEYTLFSEEDISSEEKKEIDQLLRRIFEIQQEIRRLTLIHNHLEDDRVFELDYNDLISYGFQVDEI